VTTKQLLKKAEKFLSEREYWHGGNSNGDIPKAMVEFLLEQTEQRPCVWTPAKSPDLHTGGIGWFIRQCGGADKIHSKKFCPNCGGKIEEQK
jgi:hypothetical protein